MTLQDSVEAREHVRNIALDLIVTILTCGLFNIYVQYRQMLAVNAILRETKYLFLNWAVFSLLTCGLYHIYHEYRKSLDLAKILGNENSLEPVVGIVLAIFGFWIVTDAIQQSQINRYYGSQAL